MTEYLFSYGTLQTEKTQLQLFGRRLVSHPDLLPGYTIREVTITDPVFLATGEDPLQRIVSVSDNPNDSIPGAALELTQQELLIADQYEPPGYKRVSVVLASGTKAWIYADDKPGHSNIEFSAPWIKTDANKQHFEEELYKELIPGHPLYAKKAEAIAYRQDMDEVLFWIKDDVNEYAIVHLTYHTETDPRWPGADLYKDWQDLFDNRIKSDIRDWQEDG